MKITYLVGTAHGLGGTASAVVTQANAMSRRHDVEVLSVYRTRQQSGFSTVPEVRVRDLVTIDEKGQAHLESPALVSDEVATALSGKPSRLIPASWDPNLDALADLGLEQALPGLKTDILVTVTPALLAVASQLAPPGITLVHQEHRSSSQRTAGLEPLLAFAPRADVVAMLTDPMAHWLRNELGAQAPEIVVVPNALPPGYRPRSRLDNPLIVAAGRLVVEKQYVQLINAFAKISDRLPDWRLRIFGEGVTRYELMGVIRKHGLFDRVELPGTTADLASEWAKASISALTSTSEGFPLVIQEAMAAGVPVVSYDCPSGPRAIIDHGVDGLLVTQGSEHALAATLLRLATDVELRQRLGAAALDKAATYDVDDISARWTEIFEAAVARHHAAGGATAGRSSRWLVAAAPTAPSSSALAPPVEDQSGAVADEDGSPDEEDEDDYDPSVPDPENAPSGGEGLGLTPTQALETALRCATEAAAATSPDWFVIPSHGAEAPSVVVPMADRQQFLSALRDSAVPAFLSLVEPEGRGWPGRRGSVEELTDYLARGITPRLLLEPWPRVDGRPALLGEGATVQLEFWEEDLDGELRSPIAGRYTQHLPRGAATATLDLHGLRVPTVPLMVEPTVEECRFPIDIVYTWVDGADPSWNDARERRLAEVEDETMLSRASSGRARFVSREELRYSMRSLHLFAPWIRTIHLVTAGQVPDWLHHDDPRIRIVDHRDILPAEALPTFNSQAIETALHRVPDLAEHFIYFNDDVFLGRPVRPEQFFHPGGDFAVFPSGTLLGLPGQADLPYLRAGANNRRLLQQAFGVTTTHNLAHTPHPQRRSVLEEIAERFAPEVEATARAPFRSDHDVSMLSSLAQHYGLITGTAYVGELASSFVNISSHDVRRQLNGVLKRERDTFCLGDHHDFALPPAKVDRLVSEFFEDYFPVAAPWEDPSS